MEIGLVTAVTVPKKHIEVTVPKVTKYHELSGLKAEIYYLIALDS